MPRRRHLFSATWAALFLTAVSALSLSAQVTIAIKPAEIRSATYFSFRVTGVPSGSTIFWYVNGIRGGNATVGTFSGARYNAPMLPPAANPVTITAALSTDATQSDTATVLITNPKPHVASVSPSLLRAGQQTLTLNGSGFVNGAVLLAGGTAYATTYISSTRLTALIDLPEEPTEDTPILVVNLDPGAIVSDPLLVPPAQSTGPGVVSESAARRFLEQAAFGPDAYSLSRVRERGFSGWIDEQMQEPHSQYQNPATIGFNNAPVQARFFTNSVHGRDQLRQRIAFALHKIWVVSGTDIPVPDRLIPYLRIFGDYAFDNYRTIMRKVTLNPAMGEYLDMRNNIKANPARGTLPNENYSREVLQLFTIGLYRLNADGTRQLDEANQPIPTYDQPTVEEFARVFTGWTYPVMPGAVPRAFNPAYYEGDMVPWEPNHDSGSKVLLDGFNVAGGKSASDDLDAALDNIFQHPNVGPFIGRNLIQQLVMSNPSPEYVARVAAAFTDNGLGVRGDMAAMIRAILLDPEARSGDDNSEPAVSSGHLKEPVLFLAQTLRGLNAMVNDTNTLAQRGSAMGQNVFFPASVFSYFSPFYVAPGSGGLRGPEFQIQTRASAIERVNQINTLVYGSYGIGAVVDWRPWVALAATPSEFADELGRVFLGGQMPDQVRDEVISAIAGTSGTNLTKARAGLYVLLTSAYYSVQK